MPNVPFQFHKVQLKGSNELQHHAVTPKFQFHKVQLKALRHAKYLLHLCSFNSIRYN